MTKRGLRAYNGLIVKLPKMPKWISASDLLHANVDVIDNKSKKRLGRMPLKDLIRKVK